jgi:soluble lytic murein transglycosylase-like protein
MSFLTTLGGLVLLFAGLKDYRDKAQEKLSQVEQYGPQQKSLDELFRKHGQEKGVDWRLLKAVAKAESSLNPEAFNPNDPSYGLMQILCTGKSGEPCHNKFYIRDWPPKNKQALYDPDLNIHFGAQILEWNIGQYGLQKGVAVYNHWGARNTPPGEDFPNQEYVDKVMEYYGAIKQANPLEA